MPATAKRKPKVRRFYQPDNFDPLVHLPAEWRPHIDSFRYLMHLVYANKAITRHTWKEYTPLMADYLREVVPAYKQLVKVLVDNQVFDQPEPYIKGAKATGYRFHPDMRGRFSMVTPTDKQLLRRYENALDRSKGRIKWDVHKHLNRCLKKVSIDARAAHKTIARAYAHDPDTQGNQTMLVDMIADRNLYFTVDDFGHRVHTPLTTISSQLRQHLSIDGQHLVGLDVVSSQPYCLAILLINACKHWDAKGRHLGNLHTFVVQPDRAASRTTHFPIPMPRYAAKLEANIDTSPCDQTTCDETKNAKIPSQSPSPPIPMPRYAAKTSPRLDVTPYGQRTYDEIKNEAILGSINLHRDIPPLVREILSGTFYEAVQAEYNHAQRKPLDRQAIKQKVFGALYCHPRDHGRMWRVLSRLYPSAMSILLEMKDHNWREIPRQMQRQESWIMLGVIVKRLLTDHPEIPLVTIHDSILTTPEHVETVRQAMLAGFRQVGLVPRLHLTDYGNAT